MPIEQTINFPKQTESPYKDIEKLIEAGNRLIGYYKDGLIFDVDKYSLFITLIHIERAIDSCRGLIPPNSSFDFSEDKKAIDVNLDSFRHSIREISAALNEDERIKALNIAGEDFKLRFS